MKFVEVTPQQFKTFNLNGDLNVYGIAEGFVHKIYNERKVIIGIGIFNRNNDLYLVREDYFKYCK